MQDYFGRKCVLGVLMIATGNRLISVIGAAALVTALAFAATVLAPRSAAAAVFVGFGFGFPIGFPAYYPPYPYPPPAPYYPPYPAPGSYPPSASYQPSSAYPPPGSASPPKITYTPRPGWTNAQGEYCREYTTTQGTGGRATQRYGTACRDFNGQWRIVN
jgi:hypothetical protein